MSIGRNLLILLGVAISGIGIAIAATSTPVAADGLSAVVEQLGNDYLLVAVVGGLAFVLTVLFVVVRVLTGINQITPPEPEGIPTARHPGVEFDEFVDSPVGLRSLLHADQRKQVRDRLREMAIQTVMRRTNCSRDAARRQVEEGRWTDDVDAAAYLGGPGAPDVPWSSRIKAALFGRSWHQWAARRAALDIVRGTEREEA